MKPHEDLTFMVCVTSMCLDKLSSSHWRLYSHHLWLPSLDVLLMKCWMVSWRICYWTFKGTTKWWRKKIWTVSWSCWTGFQLGQPMVSVLPTAHCSLWGRPRLNISKLAILEVAGGFLQRPIPRYKKYFYSESRRTLIVTLLCLNDSDFTDICLNASRLHIFYSVFFQFFSFSQWGFDAF